MEENDLFFFDKMSSIAYGCESLDDGNSHSTIWLCTYIYFPLKLIFSIPLISKRPLQNIARVNRPHHSVTRSTQPFAKFFYLKRNREKVQSTAVLLPILVVFQVLHESVMGIDLG